jgi:hypothetical protein
MESIQALYRERGQRALDQRRRNQMAELYEQLIGIRLHRRGASFELAAVIDGWPRWARVRGNHPSATLEDLGDHAWLSEVLDGIPELPFGSAVFWLGRLWSVTETATDPATMRLETTDGLRPITLRVEPQQHPRILARFHPQAWYRDQAIGCDPQGPDTWDVAPEILAMGRDESVNYPALKGGAC